jgi:chromate transporter
LFLAGSPPLWVLGAGAGAGAAVPAVAVQAGTSLLGASWQRRKHTIRWLAYLAAGAIAAATIGVWLVLILLGCGVLELAAQHALRRDGKARGIVALPLLTSGTAAGGALLSVAWVAFKVGALSYGGGFVIIPLMQSDAVSHYHWMTGAQFLNAVALGPDHPGPGRADRRRRRLRRRRPRRRPARLRRRLHAVIRVRGTETRQPDPHGPLVLR